MHSTENGSKDCNRLFGLTQKITAEITIEIIPDEDEIKEYVKAQKKTERRSVVFFLALIICVVSILYIDIHKVHGLYRFGFFF